MKRRTVLIGLAGLPLSACASIDPTVLEGILGGSDGLAGLSAAEVALGLRTALDNGVGNALLNLGQVNGFLGNPTVRIPLPAALQDVQSVLSSVGAGGILNELETQLNRGAEAAIPLARDIFLNAVSGLTITDAFEILRGHDTAATDYLQGRTSTQLSAAFSPILEGALEDTGALRLVQEVENSLRNLPFIAGLGADARQDLIGHGVDFALDGLFHFIGEEEKAIRENPAKRTSEILRRVFG